MPDQGQQETPSETREIKDLPKNEKDLGAAEADNVKGGRMRNEPEVTKNDTYDMYK